MADRASGDLPSRPLDVLIVEDSEDDALLVVRHLRKQGLSLQFRRVETPEDLQKALDEKPWDIVLSDYHLPKFRSGLEALGILKASGLDIPLIMLSGIIDEERAVSALKAGAGDFVRKDDLSRLVPAIERELREATMRQARRRAEAEVARQAFELRKAKELKQYRDDLLAVFGHEFRTPLNFILAAADILGEELFGPINAQQREQLERIYSGIDRLLFSIDNFLLMAKVKANQLTLSFSETEYPKLVREIVRKVRGANRDRKVPVEVDLLVEDSWGMDAECIGRVLANLLDNALKVSKPGQRVSIKAYVEGETLVTQVVDCGPGISAENLARLFDPFEQIDLSSTRPLGGMGLGLSVSKAIVEAHEGKIGVISSVGQGSTFWFTLPLRQVREEAARAPAESGNTQ